MSFYQMLRKSFSKAQEDNKHWNKRLLLQRHPMYKTELSEAPPIVHEVLRSQGHQLDSETCTFMESRFSYDFSRVRVHANAKAAESARAVNAIAYTVGQNVVFGAGQYAPGTTTGKHLLAHELTHVVQQGKERYHTDVEKCAEEAANLVAQSLMVSQENIGRTAFGLYRKDREEEKKKKPRTRPLEEKLESKYTIKIIRGDKDWTEDEIRDLEWVLSRLKGKELTGLAGYEFKRWTSKESRAKVDSAYIPSQKPECGFHEVDLATGIAIISMYDDCFDPHTTMLGVALGRYNILHEIGEAMHTAEARAKQAQLNEIDAKYQKAYDEAKKTIDAYDDANRELNDLLTEYNRANAARQKVLQPTLKESRAKAKKLYKKSNILKKKTEDLETIVDQREKEVNAAVKRALNEFEALIKGKAPLTEYSKTSTSEAFAEAFALFRVNPDAIKKVNKPLHDWFKTYGELRLLKQKKMKRKKRKEGKRAHRKK